MILKEGLFYNGIKPVGCLGAEDAEAGTGDDVGEPMTVVIHAQKARAGGDVNIAIRHGSLTVSNKADDGKPLDSSVLFCRFHPGDTGNKGNGLGLAIVKAVCDFHRWNVGYRFTSGYHQFTVNFNGQ